MSTSQSKQNAAVVRAVGLIAGCSDFTVCLQDGRKIVVPYHCYPRLDDADMKQRSHFEVHAEGRLLHWPDIDEDIEVQHIIEGRMPVKERDLMAVAEQYAPYGETTSGE